VEYKNENSYPLSINGISSLEYLADISGENYSSRDKNDSESTGYPIIKFFLSN
jgi:asparagine synthase (glutamine-hydrolysing)